MTTSDYSMRPHGAFASRESPPMGIEGSWDPANLERMWVRAQSLDWRTLALVPGDEHTSTFEVANLIARLALDQGESIHVADLRELRLKHVEVFLEGTRWDAGQGDRIIFATGATSANISTVPLARAADCAILCVSLGSTSLDSVREAIGQIGRKHFLGTLLVRASSAAPKRARASRLSTGKGEP
jgi:hypothetical protein